MNRRVKKIVSGFSFKIRTVLKAVFFTLISLYVQEEVFGTDYYVSSSGRDENSGTSTKAAWASIVIVNAFQLKTGDGYFFQGNCYWRMDGTFGIGDFSDFKSWCSEDYWTR